MLEVGRIKFIKYIKKSIHRQRKVKENRKANERKKNKKTESNLDKDWNYQQINEGEGQ